MIDFLISTYIGALLFFSIGIITLIRTIKHKKKDPISPLQPYTSGIVGGIGFIIVGIIILINKILGNW